MRHIDPGTLVVTHDEQGNTSVDLKFHFDHPHEAGHVLGRIIETILESFLRANPGKTKDETMELLVDGVQCELLSGPAPEEVVEH